MKEEMEIDFREAGEGGRQDCQVKATGKVGRA